MKLSQTTFKDYLEQLNQKKKGAPGRKSATTKTKAAKKEREKNEKNSKNNKSTIQVPTQQPKETEQKPAEDKKQLDKQNMSNISGPKELENNIWRLEVDDANKVTAIHLKPVTELDVAEWKSLKSLYESVIDKNGKLIAPLIFDDSSKLEYIHIDKEFGILSLANFPETLENASLEVTNIDANVLADISIKQVGGAVQFVNVGIPDLVNCPSCAQLIVHDCSKITTTNGIPSKDIDLIEFSSCKSLSQLVGKIDMKPIFGNSTEVIVDDCKNVNESKNVTWELSGVKIIRWEDNGIELDDWVNANFRKANPNYTGITQTITKDNRIVGAVFPNKLKSRIENGKLKVPLTSEVSKNNLFSIDVHKLKLTSLENFPPEVYGNFIASDNQIVYLDGCPKKIHGNFDLRKNKLSKFLFKRIEEIYAKYNGKPDLNDQLDKAYEEIGKIEVDGELNFLQNSELKKSDIPFPTEVFKYKTIKGIDNLGKFEHEEAGRITLNSDGITYDINGSVGYDELTDPTYYDAAKKQFKVKFRKCSGNFDITGIDLVKLDGCPESCDRFIRKEGKYNTTSHKTSTQISDLRKGPNEVSTAYYIPGCEKVTTLKGVPQEMKAFWCSGTGIKSLEGGPDSVELLYVAANCEKLESLKGIPNKKGEQFSVAGCKLLWDKNNKNREENLELIEKLDKNFKTVLDDRGIVTKAKRSTDKAIKAAGNTMIGKGVGKGINAGKKLLNAVASKDKDPFGGFRS